MFILYEISKASVLLAILIGLNACQTSGKSSSKNSTPSKVEDGEKGQTMNADVAKGSLSLKGKSQVIELNLAYFSASDEPPAKSGAATASVCPAPFADDAEVGEVSCTDKGNDKTEILLGSHVRQVCSEGHNAFGTIDAKEDLPVPGDCARVTVKIFEFNPPIQAHLKKQ